MCIRDSLGSDVTLVGIDSEWLLLTLDTVSYTHLTLPTKLEV
ncbi:hypothetical protein JMUB7547_28730 [Staphylococcus aureus]